MTAYNKIKPALYNEIDPYAAQWLRNLIAAGHIAPGDVDERSITDVTPDDLRGYTQFHTFAGIGVWSFALRLAGWPDDRPVWTGSCPCQPFSSAGKGAGFDDQRHLWPYWHHLIRVCRPPVVFGEQVASKDGLGWLDLVSPDLQGEGYAFGAQDRCSAGFGAPHIRQRLYFVGALGLQHAASDGRVQRWTQPGGGRAASGRGPGGLANTESLGGRAGLRGNDAARGWWALAGDDSRVLGLGNTAVSGRSEGGLHGGPRDGSPGRWSEPQLRDAVEDGRPADDNDAERRSDGAGRNFVYGTEARWLEGSSHAVAGGRNGGLEHTDVFEPRQEREQRGGQLGRLGGDQGAGPTARDWPGPTNGPWRDADWLFCRDGKWRPVEPGTFPLAHGAPSRVGRLRAYGNAIDSENARDFIDSFLEGESEGFADPCHPGLIDEDDLLGSI